MIIVLLPLLLDSFLWTDGETPLFYIRIHYEGHFYEIVPWTGEMSWEVWPWGRWEFRGRCTDKKGETPFEAEIVAVTDEDVSGVLLRAPTKDEGMVGASRKMPYVVIYFACGN